MSEETLVAGEVSEGAIRVLSASAQRAALTACAEAFRASSPQGVLLSWATSGAVVKRIAAGEGFDLVAASREALQELAQQELIAAPIRMTGVSRIALGMRKGEPAPDISTPGKFREALLAARSFARGDPAGGGTAGNFLVDILRRLDALDATMDKSILRVGGYNVMKEVAEGRADFGLTQSTEIVAVEGVEISAYLPADLQMETVYAIAPAAQPAGGGGRAFFDFVTGPEGGAIYRSAGFADV